MTRRDPHLRLPAERLRERGDARPRRPSGWTTRSSSTPAPSPPRPSARRARRSAARTASGPARASSSPAAPRRSTPQRWAALPGVDRVLGNAEKLQRRKLDGRRAGAAVVRHHGGARDGGASGHRVRRPRARLRAGAAGLRPPLHLLRHPVRPRPQPLACRSARSSTQVRALVAAGYREVVLTGVDIASYGADLPGAPTLGQMVRRLLALVPELPRLRLSSLDPAEIDDDLWRLIAEEPRLMPHLHLSLQAGERPDPEAHEAPASAAPSAGAVVARARALRPGIAIGADLIAGFPTETEALFDETLRLRRRGGAAVPARLSLQRAARHAGRADARGADAGAARARGAAARGRRGGAGAVLAAQVGRDAVGADRDRRRPGTPSISRRCG